MSFVDDDLDVFFADFGVDVSCNGQTAVGILDTPSAIENLMNGSGAISQQEAVLRLRADAFAQPPTPTTAITVNDLPYTIRSREYEDDGKVMCLQLKAVPQ